MSEEGNKEPMIGAKQEMTELSDEQLDAAAGGSQLAATEGGDQIATPARHGSTTPIGSEDTDDKTEGGSHAYFEVYTDAAGKYRTP